MTTPVTTTDYWEGAMPSPDLTSCPVGDLLDAAHWWEVRYFLATGASGVYPAGQLLVWNSRHPKGQAISDALRARREEVIAHLRANRPPTPPFDMEEEAYRRDVNGELDMPVSELTVYQLLRIVREEARATAYAVADEAARDAVKHALDALRSAAQPTRRPRTRQNATPSDRVAF